MKSAQSYFCVLPLANILVCTLLTFFLMVYLFGILPSVLFLGLHFSSNTLWAFFLITVFSNMF